MRDEHLHTSRKQESAVPETLRSETRLWIAQLPPYLELRALTQQFPRIANRIANLWSTPVQCERYLDELLFNDRTGIRQGFPLPVCRELMQLKCALLEIFNDRKKMAPPHLHDVWGRV